MYIIETKESVNNGQLFFLKRYAVRDGVFIEPDKKFESKAEKIDLSSYLVMPGLVDIHCHGRGGVDVMDCSVEAIQELSRLKVLEGVTSFCPTTVTAPLEKTMDAIRAINAARELGGKGAKILGAFLEGPYINPTYKGAHPENFIRPVNLSEIKKLTETGGVASVIIAPELENALETIKFLTKNGINARIGHTAATYEEAKKGCEAGADIFVHTYNAMSPLNHREPGAVGAAMTLDAYAELIFDNIHVHKAAAKILYGARGKRRVILVTDCMRAGGLSDGEYNLGELDVIVKDGVSRLKSGALAGSTATLMSCVKNAHEALGIKIEDAVLMATQNPSEALDLNVGSLDVNKSADLIAIDKDFNVKFVMIAGKIIIR